MPQQHIPWIGPRKRVNYRYLAHLSERLDNLGRSIHEIPHDTLLNYNWNVIRDYITSQFKLPYCVRCKLPCAPEDMDEGYTGICKEHADTFRSSIETRQERAFERKLNRMSSQTAKISAITRQRDRQIIAETAISRVMHTDEHSLDMDAWTKKLRGDK